MMTGVADCRDIGLASYQAIEEPTIELPRGCVYCAWCDEPILHDESYLPVDKGCVCSDCVESDMLTMYYDD